MSSKFRERVCLREEGKGRGWVLSFGGHRDTPRHTDTERYRQRDTHMQRKGSHHLKTVSMGDCKS